jgi:hypothetical protein
MSLTNLTAPLTLYFAVGGSDSTGTGTLAAPFATINGARAYALANLNTAGFAVTYAPILSSPTLSLAGTFLSSQLIGGGFEIIDGCNSAGLTLEGSSVGSSYAFGLAGYGNALLQNLTLAQPSFLNDTVSVGAGQLSFGPGIVFGVNANPNNDLTTLGGAATVRFGAGYTVTKPWVQGTASFTAGQRTITINGCSSQILPGMVMGGPNCNVYAVVGSVSGSGSTQSVTLANGLPTGTQTNATVVFAAGGQNHIDASTESQVVYDTNLGASPFAVTFQGYCGYYAAIFEADCAVIELGATWTAANVIAFTAAARNNGVIETGGQLGAGVMPGSWGHMPPGFPQTGGQVT